MRVGYARVSTSEQDYQYQLDELEKAACEQVVKDKASGSLRAGLQGQSLRQADEQA